jgi:hypothetical protein
MTQPQSRLSGGALGDTAGVARDPDAGATTFTSLPRDLVRISDVRSGGTHNDSRGARVTTRAVHAASALMVAEASRGVETRARKRKRELDGQAGVAFPGLPFDVAVSLVEKHLPDPADLAVLRAVSKGMRDAVDAIGRKVEEFKEDAAVERGYLSTLKCLRRRGRLSDVRLLCAAAAGVGDLEALKALRCAENFPWDERTCRCAAAGGHLRVLKWAHENDCPWNEQTCACAAQRRPPRGAEVGARERLPVARVHVRVTRRKGGHLEVLKWARANDCSVARVTRARTRRWGGHLEVLKWARANGVPVEPVHVRVGGEGWPPVRC